MRKHGRTDANQAAIVKALRKAGASVQSLASVGDGCPDLLIGYRYGNLLMEVKDPDQPPSKRKLTEGEELWHINWRGTVHIVESAETALSLLNLRGIR